MSAKRETAIRRGTGNIFADLGRADAETHLLKAELMSQVIDIMHERKLSQTAAGQIISSRV
jgi:predicted XRE-type DNA-binding protein